MTTLAERLPNAYAHTIRHQPPPEFSPYADHCQSMQAMDEKPGPVAAAPNRPTHHSAYLFPPRPPSPHSIRSMRTVTSVVSDIRSFTAKSFDTFLVSDAPPHDPCKTPLWSAPRQALGSESSNHEDSAFFPHVPVQLPDESSPRWDVRRRALKSLNESVKFPVKDVAKFTLIPPSPEEGGNWRWKQVEEDPWHNRRQHQQSHSSSGLDGVWRLSQRWHKWRKGASGNEHTQMAEQNPAELEDPFQDNTTPSQLLAQNPALNTNKPLPPNPTSVRASLARRMSAIRSWRPKHSKSPSDASTLSPSTSASSSLVSLIWTDEDSIGYERQQHVEDEDALGRLLVQDWHAAEALAIPSRRSPGPKRKGKLTDSGLYLFPLRAMERS